MVFAEFNPLTVEVADGWNGLGFALPRCDAAVAALLQDLLDRGLLDSTLVVLAGEFGRPPRISKGGSAIGRTAIPSCSPAPVSLPDFTATCLQALDIPPETRISPDGFSVPASTGQPIAELFG